MPLMTEADWRAWLAVRTTPRRVRIKIGWAGAGREGDAHAVFTGRDGQVWMAVQWDGEDDPDSHKIVGLEDASRPVEKVVYEKSVRIELVGCIDCPNHEVVPDPDPHDSFNSDDEALLCKAVPADGEKSYCGQRFPHKAVSVSNRPYETAKTPIPNWCPLRKKEEKGAGAKEGSTK